MRQSCFLFCFVLLFSQSWLSVQTLLRCPYSPRGQQQASKSVRTWKIPSTGSHSIVWTHENTAPTAIGMGSAAFEAAEAYPGKATRNFCMGLKYWKKEEEKTGTFVFRDFMVFFLETFVFWISRDVFGWQGKTHTASHHQTNRIISSIYQNFEGCFQLCGGNVNIDDHHQGQQDLDFYLSESQGAISFQRNFKGCPQA